MPIYPCLAYTQGYISTLTKINYNHKMWRNCGRKILMQFLDNNECTQEGSGIIWE